MNESGGRNPGGRPLPSVVARWLEDQGLARGPRQDGDPADKSTDEDGEGDERSFMPTPRPPRSR